MAPQESNISDRRSSPQVALVGGDFWLGVVEHLFGRAGIAVAPVAGKPRWFGLSWIFSRTFLRAKVVHMVWGGHVIVSIAARLLGKTLVWHWIGSDILAFRGHHGAASWLRKRLAHRSVRAHLADSPELAEELKELGIAAQVCRLLPSSIEAEVLPLPEKFRVLSYWTDERRTFYGGDLILELAKELDDIDFLIAGADGHDVPHSSNVTFLGQRETLDHIYPRVWVFLRLPKHDSLSAMVLESLARGRYVIYNKAFPHCRRAETMSELRSTLREIRDLAEPNRAGAAFVKEQFSLQHEADILRRVYNRLPGA